MMYMCKKISKENVVSMYDERVAELEHLLAAANDEIIRHTNMQRFADERYQNDTTILAGVLFRILDENGLDSSHLYSAIDAQSYNKDKVVSVLEFHDAVPDNILKREYKVSMTIPVTITVKVTATDEDQAEEIAADEVESNGIDCYYMDYDLHYNVDYEVNEV
jgi:hypothetical protein